MPKFKEAFKKFLIYAVIEGFLCLVYLFAIPSKPITAWFLGYSKHHWFAILFCLVLFAALVGLSIKTWRDSTWLVRMEGRFRDAFQSGGPSFILWTLLAVTVSLFISAIWISSSKSWNFIPGPWTYRIGGFLYPLEPVLIWIGALSIQSLVMLWRLGYQVRPSIRVLQFFSILSLPFLYIFFISLGEDHYREITKEDRLVEWLTVGVFLITALLAFIRAVDNRKHNKSYWFLLVFSLASILFALEEISWGQRIFEVGSTDFFLENSDQQEINVHNVINEIFSIRTKHVAAWTLLAYGVALPVLALNQKARSFIGKLGIVISPSFLIPGYILSSILTWDRFFSGNDEEMAEFFFSILLCLVIVYQIWYTNHRDVRSLEID